MSRFYGSVCIYTAWLNGTWPTVRDFMLVADTK